MKDFWHWLSDEATRLNSRHLEDEISSSEGEYQGVRCKACESPNLTWSAFHNGCDFYACTVCVAISAFRRDSDET